MRYVDLMFPGVPKLGNQFKSGYISHTILEPNNCYITLTFYAVPMKECKIKSGYLTRPFSGANKCAECHVTPASLGGAEIRGQN